VDALVDMVASESVAGVRRPFCFDGEPSFPDFTARCQMPLGRVSFAIPSAPSGAALVLDSQPWRKKEAVVTNDARLVI